MKKMQRSTLAQTQRDRLVEQIRVRGKKASNIWYVFSPGSRTNVILIGDLRYELFLITEGDPAVIEAQYETEPIRLNFGEEEIEVRFDAIVRFADGHRECRDARLDPLEACDPLEHGRRKAVAESVGARYVEFTPKELDKLQQRRSNWVRAVAALSRCRTVPLEVLEFHLLSRVKRDGRQTLDALLTALSEEPPAHVVAAVVSLLRKRHLSSDLDTRQWSRKTSVWSAVQS